jgi:predicted NAD-dependent protein-ADP-ribosyltransferase YbiA (DUF1768 family)
MKQNRDARRQRRRKVIMKAASLARELHSQDEKRQAEFMVDIINKAVDIPGLNENAERKILMAVADLLLDLASED